MKAHNCNIAAGDVGRGLAESGAKSDEDEFPTEER